MAEKTGTTLEAARPNALIREKSPYLLRHAYHPVRWHPWKEETFAKAKREHKPVFLSVGYLACHWCHVMEKESFTDPEVADTLNHSFIAVKVDREERPDIDGTYMAICQALTGSGGWPLTILMTPDKVPFFAGTYFPKLKTHSAPGLKDILIQVEYMWKYHSDDMKEYGRQVMAKLVHPARERGGTTRLDESVLELTFAQLANTFDGEHGGFDGAPKFPSPHQLTFLLRYWKRNRTERPLAMVKKTLSALRRGGIHDHLGGGFHRYATDRKWMIPHFEKMLYDQAMIALAFTEAYQVTGDEGCKKTALETIRYVRRDLASPGGGFISSEDADSEEGEGAFYLWSEGEIRGALPPELAEFAVRAYGITAEGNFHEEGTHRRSGRNILFTAKSLEELAGETGAGVPELRHRLETVRQKLLEARASRPRPPKDDQVLTDWNGLMIASLARAARVFADDGYIAAAEDAVRFLFEGRAASGKLMHRYRDGEWAVDGFVDDYAFLLRGLLELYEATFSLRHLEEACRVADYLIDHFHDHDAGGLFFTSRHASPVLDRRKEFHDGPYPAGNSAAALDLLRLARLTGRRHYEAIAGDIVAAASVASAETPLAFTALLQALDFSLGPSQEIVITGKTRARDTRAMVDALREEYLPNAVILFRPAEDPSALDALTGFTSDMAMAGGRSTAYVCRERRCAAPLTDPELLGTALLTRKKETTGV